MKKLTIHKSDAEIHPSQAAYRPGRSTTEHVFTTKMLPQKAITSQCYTMHFLVLDMSKAFDTVDRAILINNLKTILDPDELHLIKIILNTKLTVRCETEESDFFKTKTNTGVPQGDGFSANEFTLYLARAFYKENNDHICKKSAITTSSQLLSISKHDHQKDIDKHFAIYQEYADDTVVITSDKNKIHQIKKAVCSELETRNTSCERNKNRRK